MKRYTITAMLALCLAFGAHPFGCSEANAVAVENFGGGNNPSEIKPSLAKSIIKLACKQAGMEGNDAWVQYVQGVNTIEKIPGYYRVVLQTTSNGFVVIDIVDDL